MEYAVEMFGKLGLRYLIIVDGGDSTVVGVIIKKRLVLYCGCLSHTQHSCRGIYRANAFVWMQWRACNIKGSVLVTNIVWL